ncbi:hypothetical protein [Cryobacterium arcticum]|uniref:Uncharacterized protein n=1 Tax=Cryobacterium arcticum TaxID=670052 RepID=A0A1B1BKG4_9MICO|nr:hypothetical protein [Cryobacterium arcticum]ANP73034.1 hypothetical protein PA27867_2082 [Cryobacterium arcticum]
MTNRKATPSAINRIEVVFRSSRPDWVPIAALGLSLLAVFVTLWVAIFPSIETDNIRNDNARDYLELVISTQAHVPLSARTFTVADSDADDFAVVVSNVWNALSYAQDEREKLIAGSVVSLGEGRFEVCFPVLDVKIFGGECVEAARFEFTDQNLIQRFTVDGLMVDSVMSPTSDGHNKLTRRDDDPVDIYAAGTLRYAKTDEQVSVFYLERHPAPDRDEFTATFGAVTAQDESEEDAEIMESRFPESLRPRETSYAVIRTTQHARYLATCWTGIPDVVEKCEWTYGLQ